MHWLKRERNAICAHFLFFEYALTGFNSLASGFIQASTQHTHTHKLATLNDDDNVDDEAEWRTIGNTDDDDDDDDESNTIVMKRKRAKLKSHNKSHFFSIAIH